MAVLESLAEEYSEKGYRKLGPFNFEQFSIHGHENYCGSGGRFEGYVDGEGSPVFGKYFVYDWARVDVYHGEIREASPHGYGLLIDKEAEFLVEGYWKNGHQHGVSFEVYDQVDFAEGVSRAHSVLSSYRR